MKKTIITLMGIIIIVSPSFTTTWPIGTTDDMSSSFGPRNMGDVEYGVTPEEGQDPYDYDFHRGVDIGVTGSVEAIRSGTVDWRNDAGFVVKSGSIYIRYFHINHSLEEDESVTEGQNVGTVSGNHLDIKYYETEDYHSPNYSAAKHPMQLLPYTNNNSAFIISDPWIYCDFGYYVAVYITCDDDELDNNKVELFLSGTDSEGFPHDQSDILAGIGTNNIVDFNNRINCGDGTVADSDTGFNNEIRILPHIFEQDHNYHTVYFRFYLDGNVYSSLIEFYGYAKVTDIGGYYETSNNVGFVGFDPPPGAPPPPTGLVATANSSNMTVELQWYPSPEQWETELYAIYRRPTGTDPLDAEVIGVSVTTSFVDDYQTSPGATYYYAVAAINEIGEGLNSDEVSAVMPGSGHVTTDRVWKGNISLTGDVTINSGVTLTIFRGATVTFPANSDDQSGGHNSSKSELIVNGTLTAQGISGDHIIFQSTNSTPGDWYGIFFEDGSGNSLLEYSEVKDGYYGMVCFNGSSPTIKNNIISGNKYGVYLRYNGNSLIEGNEIKNNNYYGILIYNSNSTGNQPLIKNNKINNNGSWGIYCNSSSPKLYKNTITYNGSRGLYCNWYSSAQLGWLYTHGENIIAYNSGDEIYAKYSSNLILGEGCGYYGMNNSVYDTNPYLVRASYNCNIMAEGNWWGTPDPDPDQLFYMYSGSSIDYIPWLTEDPNEGRPLTKMLASNPDDDYFDLDLSPESNKTSVAKQTMSLIDSLSLRQRIWAARFLLEAGQFNLAMAICSGVINSYPDSSASLFALDVLWMAYRESGRVGFRGLLNRLIRFHNIREIGGTASLINATLLSYEGRYQKAFSQIRRVQAQFPNSELDKMALFTKGLIYLNDLYDREAAREAFMELASNYPDDPLVMVASILLDEDLIPGRGKKGGETPIEEVAISSNYPNPFNIGTTIHYQLTERSMVILYIYNILGQEIRGLVSEEKDAGVYSLFWDGKDNSGRDVASGLYIVQIQACRSAAHRKIMMLK